MSDILERVQTARQAAIKGFLKEYATHNLATFMMDTENHMREAVASSGWLNFYKERTLIRNKLLSFTYRELLTDDPAEGESDLSKAFELILKRDSSELYQQYMLLKSHYSNAMRVREKYRDPDATEADKEKAIHAARHLHGTFKDGLSRAIDMKARVTKESKGIHWEPEVLVLQGGGAKGMSYVGVIQAMEDSGHLKNIKMVAGTSAGALMGVLVAMGYVGEDITKIVMTGRFAHFFAESTSKFKGLMKLKDLFVKTTPEKTPHYEGDLLVEFTKNHFMPELARVTGISVKRWSKFPESVVQEYLSDLEVARHPIANNPAHSVMWDKSENLVQIYEKAWADFVSDLKSCGREGDSQILKFGGVPGRSEAHQAALTCIRVERPNSLDDGDIIEAFIGDLIQERVKDIPISILRRVEPQIVSVQDMRNLNFSQLKQLQELWPLGNFKEFGVAATVSFMPFSLSNVVQLGYRTYEKAMEWVKGEPDDTGVGEHDKKFAFKPIFFRAYEDKAKAKQSQMPIKKAVRASMNLPFLFNAMNLNGSRIVDGGINNNFPHRIFADRYKTPEEAKDAMIGFMLSTVESDIEMKAIYQLVHSENSVLMDIIESEFVRTPKTKPFTHALMHPISHFSKFFKRFVADNVEAFMVSNNALPSLESLDNIGIINTGMIGTAQFNASTRERMILASQGTNAFLDLTSFHSDKKLRYAMGRLVSLSGIENKLLAEKGLDVDLQDPMYRLRDPDLLADCLAHERYDDSELDDLIFRKEKLMVGGLPPHLTHFTTGLSYQ